MFVRPGLAAARWLSPAVVAVDAIKPPMVVHGMSGLTAIKWAKKSDKLYLLDALRGAKRELDPRGMMNPGVLIDP